MLSGTDIGQKIQGLTGLDRETALLEIVKAQGLASVGGGGLFRNLSTSAKVNGKSATLIMQCSPLPLAAGTDDDFLLLPMWPWTYQTICDGMDFVLPTKKMCLLVAQLAEVRIDPAPISPNSESSDLYVASNKKIRDQIFSVSGYSPEKLVVSPKKDVVTGPDLDGTKVAIFGWFRSSPLPPTDTKESRWQPYSTVHSSQYVDYSHSMRVFRRKATLNGSVVDLTELCADSKYSALVSDQGSFPMKFPSKDKSGATTTGKIATSAGLVGGAAAGGVLGFILGGPPGAAIGALVGGAIGRNV